MKIVYLVVWRLGSNDGVVKKIRGQVAEWRRRGHEVLPVFITDCVDDRDDDVLVVYRTTSRNPFARFPRNRRAYQRMLRSIEDFGPDVIYSRQSMYRRYHGILMRKFPFVTEVNTDDMAEMRLKARASWKGRIHFARFLLGRSRYYSGVAGMVSVTFELARRDSYARFRRPIVTVPNGIMLEDFDAVDASFEGRQEGPGRLVFIGGTYQARWHGLDHVLELADAARGELEIDVIGPDLADSGLPPNVRSHGFLTRDKYLRIFSVCDAGLGSAALYRNNLGEACILKVREYLAAGLPVVLPYEDTAFLLDESPRQPPWLLRVENCRDGLVNSKDEIVDFCRRMRGVRVPRREVAPVIDFRSLESMRLDFLDEVMTKGPGLQ